jgi:hypothetical protein
VTRTPKTKFKKLKKYSLFVKFDIPGVERPLGTSAFSGLLRRSLLLGGAAGAMGVVSACSGKGDGAGQSPSEFRSAAPAKQSASAAKLANAPEILAGVGHGPLVAGIIAPSGR